MRVTGFDIDGRTRVVMGWSLAMSESHIAVGDAIRNAISNYGVPLIYYSDNGGGEKNGKFDADVTGIFSRLGITHPTGIPGNPQGRGIIERINREIPMRVAKKFGSYVGKRGDKETQRKYRKAVDSAVNAIEKGKPLNGVQAAAMRKVPAWSELIAEIEFQIERHNNRPHSELPKRDNGEHWSPLAYRAHALEQEPHQINYLTSSELHEMFRPEVERVAIRGEIQLFNNRYFSTELANVEGEKVRVCFDIHDPNSVIIRSSSEFQSTSGAGFRLVHGNYGTFLYQDGANFYLMLTKSGDQYGTYNNLRPLIVNLASGAVTIGELNLSNWSHFDARYYTKTQSDAGYMPKTGAYTKAESDGRFQPKGSYTPAGEAYTKAQSDGKYPTAFRVGSRVTYNGSDFGGKVPQGAVNINNYTNNDDRINGVVYAYLQFYLNGKWVNFS